MTFRPAPVQRPRIPIWVVGAWPKERSMRRVLRWDGIVTQTEDVESVRAIAEYLARERPADPGRRSFDIVVQGSTPGDDPGRASEVVHAYAEAGGTWWIEANWEGATLESVRRRIQAGPPARSDDRATT